MIADHRACTCRWSTKPQNQKMHVRTGKSGCRQRRENQSQRQCHQRPLQHGVWLTESVPPAYVGYPMTLIRRLPPTRSTPTHGKSIRTIIEANPAARGIGGTGLLPL